MAEKYYISSNKYSLQERMTKRGKVYDLFFRIVTLDGLEKQKKLSGFATKTLAKQAYMEFVTEKCELVKNNPLKKKKVDKEVPFIGDLFRQYLSSLGNQNKQSVIYDKENVFRNFILPKYENTPITKLTKQELVAWQEDLWITKNKEDEFFSYSYLSKIRGFFNSFLSWVENRYGFKNYLPEVKKPKRRKAKREMKFWTREQFASFIEVVDSPLYHALFTFMFFTGRRKGEIFALYKTDIHGDSITFDKSVNRRNYRGVKWQIESTKAEKVCTLPVCQAVQDEIKLYTPPEEGKFYFGGEKPLAPTTVDRAFKKYTELAKLPSIRLHDLRHSFVSMLIHLSANTFCIAELISDEPVQIMETYGHLYMEDKISVISRIK